MIEELIAAIQANAAAQVRAILGKETIITKDEWEELSKAIEALSVEPQKEVAQLLRESKLIIESEQNNIVIHSPFQAWIMRDESGESNELDPFITNSSNSQICITDKETNQLIQIPVVSYFLITNNFHAAYSYILRPEFNSLDLSNVDAESAQKALLKYSGSDSKIDIANLSSIQEVLNKIPEVIKYINFASLQTKSQLTSSESKLDELTNLITNEHFQHIVKALEEAGHFGDLLPALEALAETPEIFFLFNLGPVVTKNPNLATQMVGYITEKSGSIYGHIAKSEGGTNIIEPILAYTVDHKMGELSALLMEQADPLEAMIPDNGFTPPALYHPNNTSYISNIEDHTETPILIHLMRSDFAAAELYMRHHPKHRYAVELDKDNTQMSAFELSITLGNYTLEQALENWEKGVYISGGTLSRIITSPEDVRIVSQKVDLKHANIHNSQDALAIKIPLITYFMENERWDIVEEMIKVGVDLFAQKTISKFSIEGKDELLSSEATVWELMLSHGSKKEDLIQHVDLASLFPEGILNLYNKDPGLTIELIKSKPIPVNRFMVIEGEGVSGNILYHAIHVRANDLFDAIYAQDNVDAPVLNRNEAPLLLFAIRQNNKHVVDKLVADKDVDLFLSEVVSTAEGQYSQGENTFHALLRYGYTVAEIMQIISNTERSISYHGILTLASVDEELAAQLSISYNNLNALEVREVYGDGVTRGRITNDILYGKAMELNLLLKKSIELNYFQLADRLLNREDINVEQGSAASVISINHAISHNEWNLASKIVNHSTFRCFSSAGLQGELLPSLATHPDHESRDSFMQIFMSKAPHWFRGIGISQELFDICVPDFIGKYLHNSMVMTTDIFDYSNLQPFEYCLYTQKMDSLKEICSNPNFPMQRDRMESILTTLGQEETRKFFNNIPVRKETLLARSTYSEELTQFFDSTEPWEEEVEIGPIRNGLIRKTKYYEINPEKSFIIECSNIHYLIARGRWHEVIEIMAHEEFKFFWNSSVLPLLRIKLGETGLLDLIRDHSSVGTKILFEHVSSGETIKKLISLENSPFSINAEDHEGNSLVSVIPAYLKTVEFYNWLFENGYIPREKELVLADSHNLIEQRMASNIGYDAIADPLIAAATKFYMTKLLAMVGNDAATLDASAMTCLAAIGHLKRINHPYAKLLKLADDTKFDLLRALEAHDALLHADAAASLEATRDEIVDKVHNVMRDTYISDDRGYATYIYTDNYDEARDHDIMINLRQAIGAVKLCIDRYMPNRGELEALCKDAILCNIEKVEPLLRSAECDFTISQSKKGNIAKSIYGYLKHFSDEQLHIVFNSLTNLDCIQVIRCNKLADFVVQMYMSATNYSYVNGSACNHGTFVQVAHSLTKIMPEFVDKLAAYYAGITDSITIHNLGDLPTLEAKALLKGLSEVDSGNEALEFFMGEDIVARNLDVKYQKLFCIINRIFKAEINRVLPGLERLPTGEEYKILIAAVRNTQILKKYITEYEESRKEAILADIAPEVKIKAAAMKDKLLAQKIKAAICDEYEDEIDSWNKIDPSWEIEMSGEGAE